MLSIAVCTYNRVDQLSILLNQFMSMRDWLSEHAEIIIVDNNSFDSTQDLLSDFQESLDLHVFFETEQGLSAARNRALTEFKGDALLFLDDDVTVSLKTFQTYLSILNEQPEFGFLGGKISVDWQGSAPKWLKSNDHVLLNGLFGQYDLGDENLTYSTISAMPFGANFVLRRELINKVGIFDTRLGVIGQQIGRGEETDYFNRARQLGFEGLYCVGAEVGHRFQTERINVPYLYRYGIEKGRAAVLINNSKSDAWLLESISYLTRGIYQLCRGRRDRFYQCVINIGIKRGVYSESQTQSRT